MATWQKALDVQLSLIRFFREGVGRGFYARCVAPHNDTVERINQYDREVSAGALSDDERHRLYSELDGEGHGYADDLAEMLDRARTYWVSEEMTRLLYHAHSDFPGDYILRTEDLPSPSGFVLFERPMDFDFADPWVTNSGVFTVIGLLWDYDEKARATNLFALQPDSWGLATYQPALHKILDVGGVGRDSIDRLMLSLWLLCNQRVADSRQQQPQPRLQRRAQRMEKANLEDGIAVVTLRRLQAPPSPSATSSVVEWSCRWIVSAHWRNQWYPGSGEHRPKWIHPYPKGPDDKPLVLKDRVYRWVR